MRLLHSTFTSHSPTLHANDGDNVSLRTGHSDESLSIINVTSGLGSSYLTKSLSLRHLCPPQKVKSWATNPPHKTLRASQFIHLPRAFATSLASNIWERISHHSIESSREIIWMLHSVGTMDPSKDDRVQRRRAGVGEFSRVPSQRLAISLIQANASSSICTEGGYETRKGIRLDGR